MTIVIGFSQASPSHMFSSERVESVEDNLKVLSTFSVQLQFIFQEAEDGKNYQVAL